MQDTLEKDVTATTWTDCVRNCSNFGKISKGLTASSRRRRHARALASSPDQRRPLTSTVWDSFCDVAHSNKFSKGRRHQP